jgi:hypothetical protein
MTIDTVDAWLARAVADANARGLPELQPLLQALARSTQALRDADAEFGHPAARHEAPVAHDAATGEADATHTAADTAGDDHRTE